MAQPQIEAILQAQEPLPPYELDPRFFDDPKICRRIGDLIARPTVLGQIHTVPPGSESYEKVRPMPRKAGAGYPRP